MKFERNLDRELANKVKTAMDVAPSLTKIRDLQEKEIKATGKFLKGEYDVSKLQTVFSAPDMQRQEGIIYFDTLPEFIMAVRKLIPKKELQDEILDHENAHALEAQQRGYSFKYAILFARKQEDYFVLKLERVGIKGAGVDVNYFDKNGKMPTDQELREDLIAMLVAPEKITNGTMSNSDRRKLG